MVLRPTSVGEIAYYYFHRIFQNKQGEKEMSLLLSPLDSIEPWINFSALVTP